MPTGEQAGPDGTPPKALNFDSGFSLILIKSYSEEMKIASASMRTTLQVVLSIVIPLEGDYLMQRSGPSGFRWLDRPLRGGKGIVKFAFGHNASTAIGLDPTRIV